MTIMGLGETALLLRWVPGFAAGTGKTSACIRYRPGVKPYVAESDSEAYAKHMLALRPTPDQLVSR